jgi:hypothetical protein
MNNGNTINPGQLSNMADQTNDNDFSNLDLDTFDPETFNPEASDLGTFDPETFGLNGFDANGFYDMNHDTSLTELTPLSTSHKSRSLHSSHTTHRTLPQHLTRLRLILHLHWANYTTPK